MLNLSPLRNPKMKVKAPSIGATAVAAAGATRAPPVLVSQGHSEGERGLDSCQLEAIADMLQEQLNNDGFVQDRQVNGQVLHQSFFGADAVSLLQDLLQNDTSTNNNNHDSDGDTTTTTTTVTRQQALQAGRTIQDLFGLFTPPLLTDTQTDLFQFQNNLPMQVASVRKLYPSPWDRVELIAQELTSNMDCDTDTCTTTEPTFTAKQIIDTFMEVKLVKTRKEGVLMVRRLNEKVHCCKLASCQHPFADHNKFRDDDTLYALVKPQHRLPQQLQAQQSQSLSSASSSTSQHKRGSKKNLKTLDIHGSSGDIQALKAKMKANNKHKQRMMRKTKSSLDITPMIKDSNYFKERVGSLKSQLDIYRRDRAINNAQKNKTNDNTTTANNNTSTKNFVWSMGKGKREDSTSHKHKHNHKQNNALTAKVATPAAC